MKPICMMAVVAAVTGAAFAQVDQRAHKEDLKSLQFRTVNGESIVGDGDITLTGAGDYRAAEDVTAYGAVGDGVTDDTAAVQAACAAAKASGKPVFFPSLVSGHAGTPATYLVTNTVVLGAKMRAYANPGATLKSSAVALRLTGAGAHVSDLTVVSTAGNAIVVDGASGVMLDHVRVNATADAIVLAGAQNVTIVNSFVNDYDGTGVRIGADCSGVSLRNNRILGGAYAIFSEATASGSRIVGNHIASAATGIGGHFGTGAVFANNTVGSCTAYGVDLTGGTQLRFADNTFMYYDKTAVPFRAAGLVNSVVCDNTIANFVYDRYSIYVNPLGAMIFSNAEKLVVRGNVTRKDNNTGRGFAEDKAGDPKWPTTAHVNEGKVDLHVTNSTDVQITANIVDGVIDIATGNTNVVKADNIEVPAS